MKCTKCLFWKRFCKAGENGRDADTGVCHRYPPVLDNTYAALNDSLETSEDPECYVQPITYYYEFCGEFKAKK